MRFIGTFLSLALAASAQQIGTNSTSSAGPTTFQASTQLVIETVSVKDKNGKVVNWAFETMGPTGLARMGRRRDSLMPGTR